MIDIPKNKLSKGAKVGVVLLFDGETITIASEETQKLKKEIG
ncbi:DUF3006 domain-containing protein [Metabacillus elymi]|uniref:DUF3006 domain-containing protein n=1 Tax=Metabacillus elymi TaxID=2745198 RepID=A0ABX6S6Q5_9BACI|nr:DUF3006 domain-containing protein [Metabacillus sp. KUDC1714]